MLGSAAGLETRSSRMMTGDAWLEELTDSHRGGIR